MAQHGQDCLGRSQALHGYLSECIQRLLCEFPVAVALELAKCVFSSLEMVPVETTKDITGFVDALTMSLMSPGIGCQQQRLKRP